MGVKQVMFLHRDQNFRIWFYFLCQLHLAVDMP